MSARWRNAQKSAGRCVGSNVAGGVENVSLPDASMDLFDGLRWLWLVVVVLIIDLGSKYLILQNFCSGGFSTLFPSLNLPLCARGCAAQHLVSLAIAAVGGVGSFAGIAIGISVILGSGDVWLEGRAEAEQYRLCADYWRRAGQPVRPPVARLRCRYDRLLRQQLALRHLNLADTAICVGAALIVLEGFFLLKQKTIINPSGCDADASYPAYRLLRNRRPDKAFTPHPAKYLKYKSKPACLNLYEQ